MERETQDDENLGLLYEVGPQAMEASWQGQWQSCAQGCMRGMVQAEFLHQSSGACTTNTLQTVRSWAAEHAKAISYYIRQITSQQVLGYPRCSSHWTQKGKLHL